jgi:hypothetical protein
MDVNTTNTLDFSEWSQNHEQTLENDCDLASAVKNSEDGSNLGRTSEAFERIRKLCRVCSSNGLIDIHSKIKESYLKINRKTFANTAAWNVTIAHIIAEVSGQKVKSISCKPLDIH